MASSLSNPVTQGTRPAATTLSAERISSFSVRTTLCKRCTATSTVARAHARRRPDGAAVPAAPPRNRAAQQDYGDEDDEADGADDATASATSAADAETQRALRRAVRLLDYRDRSSGELLKRLQEPSSGRAASSRPVSVQAARRAVDRAVQGGLVDDARFAENFVRRKWQQRREAPGAVRRALLAAGVPAEVGEEALAAFFGPEWGTRGGGLRAPANDGDEEEEEEAAAGGAEGELHGASWSSLVEAARAQARRSAGLAADPRKRRARLARWLAARGHGWDTVAAVLKEVEEEEEEEEGGEEGEEGGGGRHRSLF
jgi:SOS response regulatory protein OraA/RecX